MLLSLHAVSTKDESVCLAYYFAGGGGPGSDDDWEAALAEETKSLVAAAASSPISLSVGARLVVLQTKGDLVFIMAGDPQEDELGLVSHLQTLITIITAVCEDRLTPAQMVSFHGKVIQCLHEAYPGGMRRNTNVESVLRAAKLKAFKE